MQDYAYICETVLLYYAKVFAGSVALVGRGNDKEVHEPYIHTEPLKQESRDQFQTTYP